MRPDALLKMLVCSLATYPDEVTVEMEELHPGVLLTLRLNKRDYVGLFIGTPLTNSIETIFKAVGGKVGQRIDFRVLSK